jgi:ABC-type transport system involved in multi-copper enzyme maturation permease subunit
VIGLARSELLKLRTTRTAWWFGGSALALLLLAIVLPLAIQSSFDEHDVRALLASPGLVGLMTLVLGVVSSAGEYRHGTIAATLLVTPDRLRVSITQALACGVAGAAAGLGGVAVTALIAFPWLAAKDAPGLGAGEVAGLFASIVLYAALAGALGAGVGALLRNQVAAIVLLLVVILVVDPAVAAVFDPYAKWSLNGLTSSLTGGTDTDGGADLLPVWAAALVWAGYTAMFVGAAAVLTSRRDI